DGPDLDVVRGHLLVVRARNEHLQECGPERVRAPQTPMCVKFDPLQNGSPPWHMNAITARQNPGSEWTRGGAGAPTAGAAPSAMEEVRRRASESPPQPV